jgi:hypothetical protein
MSPSKNECNFGALNSQPDGYEEIGCSDAKLKSLNPLNQCCEGSQGRYTCTNCGSCAGENTAGNPAAPGQLLIRYNLEEKSCCSYKQSGRGTFYNRDGTFVISPTTGLPETCDGKDDAICCKVGNGNEPDDFACFNSIELDDSVPDEVSNDDK